MQCLEAKIPGAAKLLAPETGVHDRGNYANYALVTFMVVCHLSKQARLQDSDLGGL